MLAYSSLLFLVPSVYAYTNSYTAASLILGSLTGTSILYHSYNNPVTFWLDQVAVYSTVFSSFVYGYQGGFCVLMIPTLGNAWNSYVYFYGYRNKSLSFHKDQSISDFWHATIHFVSSICYFLLLYYS